MARKSFVVLTSVVGVAAVAVGAYAARQRRSNAPAIGTAKAKPLAADWPGDNSLTEEFANVVKDESVTAS